ncbi:SurA N-terminal domain-containing protein [Ferribacterium limneticum]|uniref:SurA N-terminal domain-containing protein n=1 Tax=Ferribacterium limneticum TaxID=76259 RepID=UPI001CFAAEDF|nr:SurA N-terminal domain-containing protein [Ferribacterium limneticum]UCV30071.1 SurA N-terminal domain-containing protein [Ferribacterium limneticum]UCV33990.1 SurA N-terminal domain-containing protein [Ferribacterium limneticum]
MFDAVRNNKRIVQVFLALITLPFAFFGVDSYMNGIGSGGDVATIGSVKITQQQFQQTLRDQQERLRTQLGAQFDAKMLDNPEARKAILDDLINQRLLLVEAGKKRMFASDDAIRQTIGAIEAFKVDGKFSSERYEAALRAQGMSPAGFEAQLRQDLTLQQLATAVGQSGLVARTVSDRLLALQTEKREVMEYRFSLDSYLDKVKLAEDAGKKFYDENSTQFQMPEQAKAEYVVLSMEAISSQLSVTDAEVKAWYDGHKDRFLQAEERRASHVLVASEKLGKDKAKAKAVELLAEIRKNPAAFGDLAKKNSDDPGSASKGGDLGFFGRGMMVKSFEDTAFSLKDGEISGVVESDFGFHIIKLTGIHAAKEKPLADVKGEIEAELKKTGASRKFAEAAEAFSNMVYEQSDSLKPVAEKFKLTVKQSDWLGRQANPANGVLGNEKILAALFSDDSVKNKRNTEAVEIAPNTLVAARIVDYKPTALQPFDGVKASIETMLKRKEAQVLAVKDGEARLDALQKGEDKLTWGAAKAVSRLDSRLIPPPAAQSVFRMEAGKLPAYTGVELPGAGYALFKLTKVIAGENLDDATKKGMLQQLGNLVAKEEMQLYLAALRSRYKVEINQAALEAKEK